MENRFFNNFQNFDTREEERKREKRGKEEQRQRKGSEREVWKERGKVEEKK